ncbi:MAG: right-handed parallel beta-helix repeat-containing protein [Pseudobdellovibrionaceae bacterium]
MISKITILSASTMSLFFSVLSYADDCDSIRSAIAALPLTGGEVFVAKGIYNCGAPIVINRSNITLRGAGQDQVTIRLMDQVHAPLLILGEPKTILDDHGNYVAEHRVSDISVSEMSFDGNRAHHDPRKECGEKSCDGDPTAIRNNGITVRGANNVVIKNVTTHSMISGGIVTEKYCQQLTVHDFNSYDNYFDGLAGYETEHSEFYNLSLHDNRGAGISIDLNFNDNIIRDTKLDSNGDVGIFARNLRGNHFNRVSIQRSGNHGVFLANSHDASSCAHDNLFDSVLINGSKGFGFRLNNDCKGNRISGASNLCDNLGGGFSEETANTLTVDDSVRCR